MSSWKPTREQYLKYGATQRKKMRERWAKLKDGPCMDCGVKYPPWVMQFDHRDPTEKEFNVAYGWAFSLDRVLKEIAKCDLVCANCHAERTHRRKEE